MVTKTWQEKVCQCGNKFRTHNGSEQCYSCHLERITGGMAPEEGEYNSAHLAAGDWDEAREHDFQRELWAVELGMSYDERPGVEAIDWSDEDDEIDDFDDMDEDDFDPFALDERFIISSVCNTCGFWDYDDVFVAPGDTDTIVQKKQRQTVRHKEINSYCDGELIFSVNKASRVFEPNR